ncbi:hypothetical protein T09_4895 [Trichinella sp. T9]|nr:hypothetical protein T09_4895 [Trichinella sp. T9]
MERSNKMKVNFNDQMDKTSVQRTEQRKSENTDDIEANHGRHEAEQEKTRDMNNEEKKKRKHRRLVEQIADDTKRIADGTKQNKKRQKVYAVPRGSQFCKSGLGILRKGEVIP